MERILLVEPNYKNKYPPIGLMKISTYHKNKGDFVEFHKGLLNSKDVYTFDKVYITTLFTFDFSMCLETINYYSSIVGVKNVFVGGIASSIMPEKFIQSIPDIQIIKGQLTSSYIIGYSDNVNIDLLELDYDILLDIAYDYEMADSYFIYTSRGCPRKCEFCAVKTLESAFYDCNNIENQITSINERFGIKKRLLIMDNNILFSKQLNQNIDTLKKLGFGANNNSIKKNNKMRYYLESLRLRVREHRKYTHLLNRIKYEFSNLKYVRINKEDAAQLKCIDDIVTHEGDFKVMRYLLTYQEFLTNFFERYHYHKIKRYVDFNQGLDARLFTDAKAKKLSELAVKPCRIAFDDLRTHIRYFKALDYCVKNGIKYFSNYLLYNFEEKPHDLWTRLSMNIQYCMKNKDITLFSFPMKYADIKKTDRNYVGKHWNKKYLRAMNIILNVTKGVVAKEDDFFYRAFGKNEMEFIEILSMPDEFIRYRDFYDEKRLSSLWQEQYRSLTTGKKDKLIRILSRMADEPELLNMNYDTELNYILSFYKLRKKQIEEKGKHYIDMVLNQTELSLVSTEI